MAEPEHLDPGRVPPWLMDHAKADPNAMGWLVAGYLSGVEVGRKSGPCGAISAWPGGLLTCALGHAHVGAHQTAGPISWTDPPATLAERNTP